MWLFHAQFKKTAAEERSIRDIAIFSVVVYLKAWITAPIAVDAPMNDFTLMANLTYPQDSTYYNFFCYNQEARASSLVFV
jgi:hypothetical protein